jgi:hypothetical protein
MKALLLTVMATTMLAGCSTGAANRALNDTTTSSSPATTTTTVAATPPTQFPPASEQLAACTAADPVDIATIEASLIGEAHALDRVYIQELRGRRYIAGNILDSTGERLSSADTWVSEGPELYALSSSAEDYSTAPSARDRWPAILAESGDVEIELARCIIAAGRADAGY